MCGKHMHVWTCGLVKLVHSWTSSLCVTDYHGLGFEISVYCPKQDSLVPFLIRQMFYFFSSSSGFVPHDYSWFRRNSVFYDLGSYSIVLSDPLKILHSPQRPSKNIRVLMLHSHTFEFQQVKNFTRLLQSHHKLLKKKKSCSILGLSFVQFRPDNRVQVFARVSHFQCQAETT